MDELENIKTMWANLNERIEALENENRLLARKIINEKHKSARDRLIKKYNNFILIEIFMIIYIFPFILFNPMVIEKYRIVTGLYWLILFIFEIAIDLYLKQGIKNIDVYRSTITQISSRAAKNWKIHKLGIVIAFPLAIGACILFALAIDANEYTIYGMILGAIVGMIIGLIQLKKFIHYYRLLQST